MSQTDQTTSTDLALRRELEAGLWNPDYDFRKLLAQEGELSFWSQGFRLVDKDDLLGVPHIIISATYREGFPRAGVKGDYLSLEAIVASADILTSTPVFSHIASEQPSVSKLSDLSVFPNEAVVYNDGSTGVRRQVTQMLASSGMIDPGPRGTDVLDPADRQIQRWAKGSDIMDNRIVASPNGDPLRIRALRGLRVSEYQNEYGDARTFYIA